MPCSHAHGSTPTRAHPTTIRPHDRHTSASHACGLVLSTAQSLLERLDVTAVPSVQIFDGDDITRLAMYTCKPAEWKRVDAKVRIAMVSMQKRRGLHKLFGEPLLDILTVPIMGGG
jgi:hypothetical protein